MYSGPSRMAEAIVAILVPPACREEVLGDLHERFKSPLQYAADALRTVPMVIFSRMRRTVDAQILLIQAFALYMSFLGATWLGDAAVLREPWGLVRLAIPAGMATLGLILDDTYASRGRRSSLSLARGPMIGLGLALAFQGMLSISGPNLALPPGIMLYGCAMSLLLSSAVRMLFPPMADQLLGANAPGLWLKRTGGSGIPALKGISAALGLGIVLRLIAERSEPAKVRGIVMLLVVLLVAYQISKRV